LLDVSNEGVGAVERIGDAARRLLAELEARIAERKKCSRRTENGLDELKAADGYGLSSTPAVRPSRDDSVGTDRAEAAEGTAATLPADEKWNAGRVQYGPHQPAAGEPMAPSRLLPPVVRLRSRRNAIAHANDNVAAHAALALSDWI
jgi:hypothetical protein